VGGEEGQGSNPGGGGGGEFAYPSRQAAGPNILLYNGNRFSFKVVKRSECGVNHPSTSGTEVKEREELCLYSPCVHT